MRRAISNAYRTVAVLSWAAFTGGICAQSLSQPITSPVPAIEDRLEATVTVPTATSETSGWNQAFVALPQPAGTGMSIAGAISGRLAAKRVLASPRTTYADLAPGVPTKLPFSLPPVDSPTLFNFDNGHRVTVPADAERLEIRLATETPNAEVAIFARWDRDVEIGPDGLLTDYASNGKSGNEMIVVTRSSKPALRPGVYYIAFGVFTANKAVKGTVTVTAIPGACAKLSLDVPQDMPISFPQVKQRTLVNGGNIFCFSVPKDAPSLTIRFAAAQAGAQVVLFARSDSDVDLNEEGVLAEYTSAGGTANETIVITTSSEPPLKPADYYVAFGILSTDAPVTGTLTVLAEGRVGPPPLPAIQFTLDPVTRPTLFPLGKCKIDVPAGANTLVVQMDTLPRDARVTLYVRRQQEVDIADGRVVADYSASAVNGNAIVIATANSAKPLKEGAYYVAVAVWTLGVKIEGTLSPSFGPVPEQQKCNVALQAVTGPTLFTGDFGCRFEVTPEASKLDIKLQASPADVQIVLFLRFGADVDLVNGQVVADHVSAGRSATETIAVTKDTRPPLKPGTYYFAFGLFTTGRSADGVVTATLSK